jgi:hypothetical protein
MMPPPFIGFHRFPAYLYGNRAWPTVYLIDKQGLIRHTHLGEGIYAQTEQQIQMLLAER